MNVQLKWMEDFVVLAQTRSFSRAAELRHVTHPAFGRRIGALEAWAETPLIERNNGPIALTAAGQKFLETCSETVRQLENSREEMNSLAGRNSRTVRLATGRTLARTVMADWLVRLKPVLRAGELHILTADVTTTVQMLERNEVDFSLMFHHPVLTIKLDARHFFHETVASDKLVPVSIADVQGLPLHDFSRTVATPYLAFAKTLAMGRLVEDHLANNPHSPSLQRCIECDSADALYEYVLKGLGVAWLPWSMVHADCKAGRLASISAKKMEVRFEVRLYRPKRKLGPMSEDLWRIMARR